MCPWPNNNIGPNILIQFMSLKAAVYYFDHMSHVYFGCFLGDDNRHILYTSR